MIIRTLTTGRAAAGVAAALFLLAAAGCAKTGKVSGTVTFQGKPLPGGQITFYSTEGRPSGSGQIEDGHYEVSDAPVGPCKVVVNTSTLLTMGQSVRPGAPGMPQLPGGMRGGGPMPGGMMGGGPMPSPDNVPGGRKMSKADEEEYKKHMGEAGKETEDMTEMQKKAREMYVEIPDDYELEQKTPLTTTVTRGSQKFDITVETPPGWRPRKNMKGK
jgi:hypothetical protein